MIDQLKQDTIKLLDKLIKTRSDSASKYEFDIENVLIEEISQIPYFSKHPEHFGKVMIPCDPLGRSVVWGLTYHAENKKTVILFGHHDAVDLADFGDVDGLDPTGVQSHLERTCTKLPEDTYDGRWLFGRGSCDMKAGLAINLIQLKRSAMSSLGINVLFLSVPDEETQSLGMRHAVHVLKDLKTQFGLEYELAILSEPHDRVDENQFTVSSGSVGKMMPVIVTKGMPTHSGIAYGGLSAISITMEIVKAIELNTEMGDKINKKMTPPPMFLNLNTYKDTYDVTTPEFTAAYFNWLYLKDNLSQKFVQLKELCVWSMEDAINQFNYWYNEYLRKQSMPSFQECMEFNFDILLFDELKEKISAHTDVDQLFEMIKTDYPNLPPHELTIKYIQKLIKLLGVRHPVVVIGLLPPFYPVVDSSAYFESHLKDVIQDVLQQKELSLRHDLYFMGISDMSYIKQMSHDPRAVLSLMPDYGKTYQIDFDAIDIDVIHIGPWGKDLHLKTERVFLHDVTDTVPDVLEAVFRKIASL